jgi:hypothetical protein
MNDSIGWCALIVSFALVLVATATAPGILSDNNAFLKDFVGNNLLNLLGVILAITLGSAGQLHLAFNQLEERYRRRGALDKARRGIKQAVHTLLALFVFAVALVVTKPMMAKVSWEQSIFNGTALWIVLFNVLILVALSQAVFGIPSVVRDEE